MDIQFLALISIVLLLVATALMISHIRTWRAFQRKGFDAEEFTYRRRQFYRRMQSSAILGILAVAIFAGYLLALWLNSRVFVVAFLSLVMLAICWVGMLAAMDIVATKRHFGRLRENCLIEQAKLKAELNRIQAARGNGKPGKTFHEGPEGMKKD